MLSLSIHQSELYRVIIMTQGTRFGVSCFPSGVHYDLCINKDGPSDGLPKKEKTTLTLRFNIFVNILVKLIVYRTNKCSFTLFKQIRVSSQVNFSLKKNKRNGRPAPLPQFRTPLCLNTPCKRRKHTLVLGRLFIFICPTVMGI